MKNLKTILLFTSVLLLTTATQAQYLSNDMIGKPLHVLAYENIKGSPYLSDNWATGTVRLKKGATYKDNLYLKYNVMDDELYFKNKDDEALAFVDAVSEFTLAYKAEVKHYKSGFNIDGYTDHSFFEVLVDGTAQLLKKDQKVILENKQYNSATIDKSFDDVSKYYLVSNGKASSIKKDKKLLLAALGSKQAEMEAYIKSNNLNLKNDGDMAKVVIYYNSL